MRSPRNHISPPSASNRSHIRYFFSPRKESLTAASSDTLEDLPIQQQFGKPAGSIRDSSQQPTSIHPQQLNQIQLPKIQDSELRPPRGLDYLPEEEADGVTLSSKELDLQLPSPVEAPSRVQEEGSAALHLLHPSEAFIPPLREIQNKPKGSGPRLLKKHPRASCRGVGFRVLCPASGVPRTLSLELELKEQWANQREEERENEAEGDEEGKHEGGWERETVGWGWHFRREERERREREGIWISPGSSFKDDSSFEDGELEFRSQLIYSVSQLDEEWEEEGEGIQGEAEEGLYRREQDNRDDSRKIGTTADPGVFSKKLKLEKEGCYTVAAKTPLSAKEASPLAVIGHWTASAELAVLANLPPLCNRGLRNPRGEKGVVGTEVDLIGEANRTVSFVEDKFPDRIQGGPSRVSSGMTGLWEKQRGQQAAENRRRVPIMSPPWVRRVAGDINRTPDCRVLKLREAPGPALTKSSKSATEKPDVRRVSWSSGLKGDVPGRGEGVGQDPQASCASVAHDTARGVARISRQDQGAIERPLSKILGVATHTSNMGEGSELVSPAAQSISRQGSLQRGLAGHRRVPSGDIIPALAGSSEGSMGSSISGRTAPQKPRLPATTGRSQSGNSFTSSRVIPPKSFSGTLAPKAQALDTPSPATRRLRRSMSSPALGEGGGGLTALLPPPPPPPPFLFKTSLASEAQMDGKSSATVHGSIVKASMHDEAQMGSKIRSWQSLPAAGPQKPAHAAGTGPPAAASAHSLQPLLESHSAPSHKDWRTRVQERMSEKEFLTRQEGASVRAGRGGEGGEGEGGEGGVQQVVGVEDCLIIRFGAPSDSHRMPDHIRERRSRKMVAAVEELHLILEHWRRGHRGPFSRLHLQEVSRGGQGEDRAKVLEDILRFQAANFAGAVVVVSQQQREAGVKWSLGQQQSMGSSTDRLQYSMGLGVLCRGEIIWNLSHVLHEEVLPRGIFSLVEDAKDLRRSPEAFSTPDCEENFWGFASPKVSQELGKERGESTLNETSGDEAEVDYHSTVSWSSTAGKCSESPPFLGSLSPSSLESPVFPSPLANREEEVGEPKVGTGPLLKLKIMPKKEFLDSWDELSSGPMRSQGVEYAYQMWGAGEGVTKRVTTRIVLQATEVQDTMEVFYGGAFLCSLGTGGSSLPVHTGDVVWDCHVDEVLGVLEEFYYTCYCEATVLRTQ